MPGKIYAERMIGLERLVLIKIMVHSGNMLESNTRTTDDGIFTDFIKAHVFLS